MTGRELAPEISRALSTLPTLVAEPVARHLVMAARLVDDDPEAAWAHAQAARRRAARVGVVREAAGIAAYHAGHFDEAVRELRTARRLTGSDDLIAVIADAERGLGRPERALELFATEAAGLASATRVELLIVASGARADLGDPHAALLMLEVAELDAAPASGSPEVRQARARLMSAYSDALDAVGRPAEARHWLQRAAAADLDGSTGARERLDGGEIDIVDLDDDAEDETGAERPDEAAPPAPTQGRPAQAPPESAEAVPATPTDADPDSAAASAVPLMGGPGVSTDDDDDEGSVR